MYNLCTQITSSIITVDGYRRSRPENKYVFVRTLLYVSKGGNIDSIKTTVFVSNSVFMIILFVGLFHVWRPNTHTDKFSCTIMKREMSASIHVRLSYTVR